MIIENIHKLREIPAGTKGAREVGAIVNGGDGRIVFEALDKIKNIFRRDGKVRVKVHEEKTRRGQWLGLLDATKIWFEDAGKGFKKGLVRIAIMMPGQGTRFSPFTQRLSGIKPFMPMLIKATEDGPWLNGAEASLYSWNLVAYYLKDWGFSGTLWKWGDEPQIPSTCLMDQKMDFKNTDIIRFGAMMKITDDLAGNKEWLTKDREGNLTGWARRRSKEELIEKLGLEGEDPSDVKAMIHIGNPAFSDLFIDQAQKIFRDADKSVWLDVDGYLIEGLALSDNDWQMEHKKDKRLQKVLKMYPDFREKCQKLKERLQKRKGSPLEIKVIDFGGDFYWGDIGQLEKARECLHQVAEDSPEAEIARELAYMQDIEPDEFGNRIVGDCVYPKDGSVRASVLVDTKIYGRANSIVNAVLVDSDLGNAVIGTDSVVFRSTVLNLVMGERTFSFNSVVENLKIRADWVHTSIPKDLKDVSKEDLEDWRADSTLDVGKDENYKVPRFQNPRSFEDEQTKMRQREVSPGDMELAINKQFRKPMIERMERYKYCVEKFKKLKFGTSGLRDTVENMTDMEVYINVRGYIRFLITQGLLEKKDVVSIGGDLRPSTKARLMHVVGKAAQDEGKAGGYDLELDFCGFIPTPVLAYRGKKKASFAIMVTGSHIPFNMNGIKFYKRSGEEVLKEVPGQEVGDEKLILKNVAMVRTEEYGRSCKVSIFDKGGMFKIMPVYNLTANQKETEQAYIERYVSAFGSRALQGQEVVLYEHSAVGNDVLAEIYERLGATVRRVGKSEEFIPIDTEKVTPALKAVLAQWSSPKELSRVFSDRKDKIAKPFAVTFTDGDKDRPGLADENGNFLTGDKLGLFVVKLLRPTFVAVGVSTNRAVVRALKRTEGVEKVVLTQIGSPHVIKAMNDELAVNSKAMVLGWEANGGFLLGSTFKVPGGSEITRLATRDAVLPLIAALYLSKNPEKVLGKKDAMTVSELIDQEIPHFYTSAGVYDGFGKQFGVDRPAALNIMAKIKKKLLPKLKNEKVVAIDLKTGEVEVRIVKKIADAEVLTFETERKSIVDFYSDDDSDLKEWNRLQEELRAIFESRGLPPIRYINVLDATQTVFQYDTDSEENEIVSHLRPSGNAPEFRNYAMAKEQERADEIRDDGVTNLIPQLAREVWETDDLRVRSIQKLGEMIRNGKLLKFVPSFRTARDGYTWGEPVPDSFILKLMGAKTEAERIALAVKYGISKDQVISERWIVDGAIDVGTGFNVPVEHLALFAEEVFGAEHVARFGTESGIIAKVLTSARPLSLQIHEFPEMIIPLEDGYAYMGLSCDATQEEFIRALKKGDMSIFNKIEIKKDVPVIVPRGMPHAYGVVRVYEVKAVNAALDKSGTISFYDRLRLSPPEMAEVAGIVKTNTPERAIELLTDKDRPGGQLIREKKDILTLGPGEVREIAQKIENYGFFKKADLSQTEFTPVLESAPETKNEAEYVRMGEAEGFVAGRYTVNKGKTIEAVRTQDKQHALFVTEGKVRIINAQGKTIDEINQGEERMILANMDKYTILAVEGPAVVYTQYRPLTDKV